MRASVVLLVVVWVLSVGACDIASAEFLNRRTVLELVFFTNLVGTITGLFFRLFVALMIGAQPHSLLAENIPTTKLPSTFLASDLWHWGHSFLSPSSPSSSASNGAAGGRGGIINASDAETASSSLLSLSSSSSSFSELSPMFLSISLANTLGLLVMFVSFQAGGMSDVYALKCSEPLFTCMLATNVAQRLLLQPLVAENLVGGGRLTAASPSARVWLSVAVVSLASIGAASTVAHGNSRHVQQDVVVGAVAPGGDGNKNDDVVGGWRHQIALVAGIAFVLVSNVLFSLRTTLQKPFLSLLVHQRPTESPFTMASLLFVNVGVVGSAMLLVPTLLYNNMSEYTAVDFVQLIFIGSTYYSYHVCNSVIIQHISCVSYSVAKQVRIVGTFLVSIAFFGREVESWAKLVIMCCLLLISTHWFAIEEGKCAEHGAEQQQQEQHRTNYP